MYQLMINRKNSKKGFTLVEVIVVLVILAILAAIMIPAMTGWIDKAKEKGVVVNARTAYLAAQTLCSEAYGAATWVAPTTDSVISLAGLSGAGNVSSFTCANGTMTAFAWNDTASGKTATYQFDTHTWSIS